MSQSIILDYKKETKKINVPKSLFELKELFIKEFNEDTLKEFSFSYTNEEKELYIYISSDNDFQKILNILNNESNIIINVKENDSTKDALIFHKKNGNNKNDNHTNTNNNIKNLEDNSQKNENHIQDINYYKKLYEDMKKDKEDALKKNSEIVKKNREYKKQLEEKFQKIGGAEIEKIKSNLQKIYESKIKESENENSKLSLMYEKYKELEKQLTIEKNTKKEILELIKKKDEELKQKNKIIEYKNSKIDLFFEKHFEFLKLIPGFG